MRKLLFLPFIFISCAKPATTSCVETALYTKANFPIGTAFNFIDFQTNPRLAQTFQTHFNSFTPENALKLANIRPVLNAPYNFSEIDSLLAMAKRNNVRVHGHTLIWHEQLPNWFSTYGKSYKKLLQNHVNQVVFNFKDDISSWDVVNEALNETGGLRVSPWRDKVGYDYIYEAFLAAQGANAEATLFYNDFNLALNPRKLDAAIKLCENLRARGIKNIGIGMQMHVSADFPTKREMAEAVEKVWKAGFKIHFSEVDVSINIQGNKNSFSEDDFRAQAKKYAEIVEVYKQIPKEYQFGITLWGVGDADSWIPSFFSRVDAPLLFDQNYQPKQAFCAFLSSL